MPAERRGGAPDTHAPPAGRAGQPGRAERSAHPDHPEPYENWRPGRDGGAVLSGRRQEVLVALRELGGTAGIAEVAEHAQMHANTVRFHLEALAEQGLIDRTVAAPNGPGRPALVFRTRRGMDPAGPRNYRLLAAVLVDQLASEPDAAARAARAGRAWGSRLVDPPADQRPTAAQSVARMVDLLDDLGFAPERHQGGSWQSVGLRHCPFLDLADGHTDVICPVHLGIMQGAAATLGGAALVAGLDAFVEPDRCVAHLVDARSSRPDGPEH